MTVIVDTFIAAVEAMDLTADYQRSRLSEAEYVLVSQGNETVKVRFASHMTTARWGAEYGYADYEVGKSNGHGDAMGDVHGAVRFVCRRFDLEVPARHTEAAVRNRSITAHNAAATRVTNAKATEAEAVKALVTEYLDATGAMPTNATIASRFRLTKAASSRVRQAATAARKAARAAR